MLASALCTVPTLYSCPSISGVFPGTLRILEVSEVVWSLESNLELECHPEKGECRGQV